jgi:hypothetical protein
MYQFPTNNTFVSAYIVHVIYKAFIPFIVYNLFLTISILLIFCEVVKPLRTKPKYKVLTTSARN